MLPIREQWSLKDWKPIPSSLLQTPLCGLLGCKFPILLAGMGGVSRHELAAAVANAGGYVMLGMVREDPALIAREIGLLQQATTKSFAVNIIPSATEPKLLDMQIDTCVELGVKAFTLFWDIVPSAVARVKEHGCLVLHQVGTTLAAQEAQDCGVDVIIAQGLEAGGHIHGRTGLLSLVSDVVSKTRLPVVASGGIATGAGIAAALAAGAQGVQCGTAFLATTESFAHDYHKQRIVVAGADSTVLTDIYVLNWPAHAAVRVLENSVTRALGHNLLGHDPERLERKVIAHEAERPLFLYSTDSPLRNTYGNLEAMPIYAGQGAPAITAVISAAERLHQLVSEAENCLNRLTLEH
ncbi:NAD(P)H-dependent flavin oxidoreductase [Aestuariivirga sp.]|uniref:NAD(P)H-dependent flavin oxidoreductase n=1 Tax=Aestuariivirga sp. TaxID=2650926 RepID=UPI0039E4A0A5